MPKLSKAKLSKREERAAEYKWELLRRNKDYIREANEVYKILEEDFTRDEIFSKYDGLREKVSKRWGISNVILPIRKFDSMATKEKLCLFKGSINMDQNLLGFIATNGLVKFKSNNWPPFKVEINLGMPKEKIMFDLGKWINIAQKIKKENESKEGPRDSDYKWLLKIYDLRETMTKVGKPMPFSQVARKMYPKRKKEDITKTLEDTINKSYQRAKLLVENAHKDVW
jgi:hypothetical protein